MNFNDLISFTWSYSSVSLYHACPYKFYRHYIEKDKRDSPNAYLGRAIHKWAELFSLQNFIDLPKILQDKKVQKSDFPIFESAISFLKSFICKNIIPYRKQIERKFEFKIGRYNFIAFLDCITYRDKIYLYDYKSSKDTKYYKEHIKQMSIYREILKIFFPDKDIEVVLVFPVCGEIINITNQTIDYSFNAIEKEITTIIETKNYLPKLNKFCRYCPYFKKECML